MLKCFIFFMLFFANQAFAQKIISFMPSYTEIIYELNAQDKLLAVGSFCDWPKEVEKLPKVGDNFRPDIEKIYSLKPELVFIPASQNSDLKKNLNKLGIITVEIEPEKNIDDIYKTVRIIGSHIKKKKEAEILIENMKSDLKKIKKVKNRRKVFMEVDFGFWTAGKKSFINEIIFLSGGENVFSDIDKDYFKVSWETVTQRMPQIIISNYSKPEYVYGLALANKVPAVREKKVFLLSKEERDLISRPGPRIPLIVRRIAEIINGK